MHWRRHGKSFRTAYKEIDTASDATLRVVGENVISNIDAALSEHDNELKELSSSRTFRSVVTYSRTLGC